MKRILMMFLASALALEIAYAQGPQRPTSNLLNRRLNGGARANNAPPAPTPSAAKNANTGPHKPSDPGASKIDVGGRDIEFNGATLDMVLMVYGNLVGKTILKDPTAPAASITLQPRKGQELTDEDKILAIETVLEMNGVHLEPYGESFMRALPRGTVRKDGIPLYMDPEAPLGETTKVVSMMLTFQNIALEEAQKALEGLKSDKGVLNVYERTSSILVTDTELNINRMREIVKKIDVKTPVTENVFVRQVKNASAQDIKTALEAIVQESQKELEKQGKQANTVQPTPFTPGRSLLNRNNPQPANAANASLVTSVSDADRGMIRGKVLILADERSNKLIIVTNKTNMDFFDKVIEQLDVETTPDTVVKVYRLKYADSEDVADMINDLIGNAPSSKGNSKGNQNQNAKKGGGANITRSSPSSPKKSVNQRSGEASTGELSKDNTTVLSDERINGLVVMTNKELIPVIEQIIEAMDVKLSQVLIETCIIEVNLTKSIKTGIDWVHKIAADNMKGAIAGGGGTTTLGSKLATIATEGAAASSIPVAGGLSYYSLFDHLDLGMVIEASKSDANSKYLASPVVMTVDNKEATIEATQMRYLLTGFTSSGTSYSTIAVPNYEQKEIGITIKTTPKINPNGTVMLEVEEEYSQVVEKGQTITTNTGITDSEGKTSGGLQNVDVDTTVTRKMSADISLENNQTVVLGGLTETEVDKIESGIPILKDIPIIGRYLFGKTEDVETRSELLVFMTPYVLNTADEAQIEAARRKAALSNSKPWEDGGWSKSKLADPVSAEKRLEKQQEQWKTEDDEHEVQRELDKAKARRAQEISDRLSVKSTTAEPIFLKTTPAVTEPGGAGLLDDIVTEEKK